ncbi:8-oxo-dGTP diphosphatase [Bacillus pakistanensis]|uniref:8-oxo-dGTP diphosphatase n=1 Tax=Rossellomorea pakistanensis TaxID=992288 RepID=A0ABS2NGU9_9BACI|nr:8-oxo-dGTP diphosphatase [Bacillus pakistanensis]MBM7587060.1 8-oxo-dGTP diphosphatase [Bacillus pakistanensis]
MNWNEFETQLYTMVMVEREGEVLLVKRPDRKGFPGHIAPGGKIDFPESPAEGAIREVREETGLKVERLIFKGIEEFVIPHKKFRYTVYNYIAKEVSGDLLENPPEGELVWVKKGEALELPMQSWFKRRFPYFFKAGTFEIHSKWNGENRGEAEVSIREL